MIRFITYDISTGDILSYEEAAESNFGTLPDDSPDFSPLLLEPGKAVMQVTEKVNIQEEWVEDGTVKPRSEFAVTVNKNTVEADGEDTFSVSGLPVGTSVEWHDGLVEIVNDGLVEFVTDMPGMYKFTFNAVGHFEKEVMCEAIAPGQPSA